MKKTLSGLALVATVSASGFAFAESTDTPMLITINGSVTLPACQPKLTAGGTDVSVNEKTVSLPNYNVDPDDDIALTGKSAFGTKVTFGIDLKPTLSGCLLPMSMKATATTLTVNGTVVLKNMSGLGAGNVGIELDIKLSDGSYVNLIDRGETKIDDLALDTGTVAILEAGYFKTNDVALVAGLVQTATTITFLYN